MAAEKEGAESVATSSAWAKLLTYKEHFYIVFVMCCLFIRTTMIPLLAQVVTHFSAQQEQKQLPTVCEHKICIHHTVTQLFLHERSSQPETGYVLAYVHLHCRLVSQPIELHLAASS